MTGRRGSRPAQSADGPTNCHLAGELLQTGQYEQVAALLHTAQTHSAQAGEALTAHILDVARRLCLACKQCQEDAAWHREAFQEVERREQALRQQLHTILDLIDGGQTPDTPLRVEPPYSIPDPGSESLAGGFPRPAQRPRLWQRIWAALGHRPSPPAPPKETIEPSLERVVQPSTASTDLAPDPPPTSNPVPVSTSPAPLPGTASRPAQPTSSPSTLSTSPAKDSGTPAIPSLVVYCLGAFRVYQGDRLITDWNGLKGKSIFKYLLAHRETPIAKDILMDLFWPDADPESARRSLHQAIYSLRQALRRGNPDFAHVYFENDCYLLNPEMSMWVDRIEFEEHLQAGRRLEAADRITEAITEYGIAESLYQGDYLEEDLYEDWPAVGREHLRRTYCELADRLSEHYVRNGEYNAAIALCHKILARDTCYEPAYRHLMRCYLAQGQRHLAVRQYQTCVEVLQVELGLGPSEETEALVQRIVNSKSAQRSVRGPL